MFEEKITKRQFFDTVDLVQARLNSFDKLYDRLREAEWSLEKQRVLIAKHDSDIEALIELLNVKRVVVPTVPAKKRMEYREQS
jgi:hypothetical protein